jgi:hypothetical protein
MRSAADILLELLNHADGTTLEVLLHPPNLQTLVERAGYDEEAFRRAQSMQPGDPCARRVPPSAGPPRSAREAGECEWTCSVRRDGHSGPHRGGWR